VQRVYGEGEAVRLGNDWAAGREHSHTCCSQQLPELQQEPAPAAAASTWVQRAALWLQRHSSSLAAWLPSPGYAAASADFAVGDEAEHSLRVATAAVPAGRGGAEASTAAAAGGQGTTGEGPMDESSTPSATAGAGASSTAVYRRLLSLQGLWSAASTYNEKSVSSSSDNRGISVPGTTVATGPSAGAAAKGCACGRGSAFAELQYNVHNLQDYDPVWEHYAYLHPFW